MFTFLGGQPLVVQVLAAFVAAILALVALAYVLAAVNQDFKEVLLKTAVRIISQKRQRFRQRMLAEHLGDQPLESLARAGVLALEQAKADFGPTVQKFLNETFAGEVRRIIRVHDYRHVVVTRALPNVYVFVFLRPGSVAATRIVFNQFTGQIYPYEVEIVTQGIYDNTCSDEAQQAIGRWWVELASVADMSDCIKKRCRTCSTFGESPVA